MLGAVDRNLGDKVIHATDRITLSIDKRLIGTVYIAGMKILLKS